ncbi:MAG: hypothetical protein WCT03_11195 [Candidatus Obscuribacterales bacterium]|jgi:hypothetical protein
MTMLALKTDKKIEPPAYVLQKVERDMRQLVSSEGQKLRVSYQRSFKSGVAFGWRETLPEQLVNLQYSLGPFSQLKKLGRGWDGKFAEPLTNELLELGEQFWYSLASVATQLPAVYPGADNFLVFTWKDSTFRKELSISIYEDEGDVFCDWVLKTPSVKNIGKADFDTRKLNQIVRIYNSL